LSESNSKKWKRRKKDRAEEILNSAYKILSKEGRSGLSTRRIAKDAGVSVATIFKYFNDKDDLIEKCYNRLGFDFIDQFQKDLDGIENLRDCLIHLARTHFVRLKRNQNLWDIFTHDINKRLKKNSEIYKLKSTYEDLVKKLILKAKKNGEIEIEAKDSAIINIYHGAIEYIAIKYRMYGEDFEIDETVNDIVNIIFKAYGKKI